MQQLIPTTNTTTTIDNNDKDNTNSIIDLTTPLPVEPKKMFGKLINFNSSNVLVQLRKLCNHPFLVLEDCLSIPDDLYYQYLLTSCGKLAILSILLDHLISTGHKVLIFCQMTTMLDILQGFLDGKGYPCYRLDGSTDRITRDKIIRAFHQSDKSDQQMEENEEFELSDDEEKDDIGNDNDDNNSTTNTNNNNNEINGESDEIKNQKLEAASIFLLSTRAG